MRLNDPEAVRAEYASEERLAARKAAYRFAEGPDPRDVAFSAVAEVRPRRVLDVGCGEGELAERMQRELAAEVVAVDQSERMVELTRARGVDARVGDVQELPFGGDDFDVAVAAWMLFHVADINRALSELARVAPRLVAVTNSVHHMRELQDLLGLSRELAFSAENGTDLLERHFARVERIDATGWLTFPDRAAAQAYIDASISLPGELPSFERPLRVWRGPYVFVADR